MGTEDPDKPPPIFTIRNVAIFLAVMIIANILFVWACGVPASGQFLP
jgi:hypothetical protein